MESSDRGRFWLPVYVRERLPSGFQKLQRCAYDGALQIIRPWRPQILTAFVWRKQNSGRHHQTGRTAIRRDLDGRYAGLLQRSSDQST
jgi:hypothetical protein